MPISKTCYFCKPVGKKECDACTNVTKSNFVGNADWLYIEQLEKENEELKVSVELLKQQELYKENQELKERLLGRETYDALMEINGKMR